MKKIIMNVFFPAVLVFLFNVTVFSQSPGQSGWTQFRGKNRAGLSDETGLISKWPDNGPQLVWKKDIGTGFSEILVSGNRFFTLYGIKADSLSGSEYIGAFDVTTGDQIWKKEIDSIFFDVDNFGDGPRSTPVMDENNIYCISSFGKLGAFAIADGKEIWKIDLVKEYNSPPLRWGFSASPLLIGELLVLEVGGIESCGFVAFNRNTGKKVWSAGNVEPFYCSPTKVTIEGKDQIIFANTSTLYSYDLNGDTLWTYNMPLRYPTAVPLFIEPNKIFVSTLSEVGSFIVKIENGRPVEVMNSPAIQNHWSSSCYHKGYLYGFNNAALVCISAEDGTVKWKKRGHGKGSLDIIDGKLIILSDRGNLILAETNPEIYTEISSFQALDGKSWTAPSFYDGKIYLRNLSQMACYKLK